LKPDCVIRASGHRQTQARHEEDKQGVPHPRSKFHCVDFSTGQQRGMPWIARTSNAR
jgi:hypothetical protein